jgi:hypothetical protein
MVRSEVWIGCHPFQGTPVRLTPLVQAVLYSTVDWSLLMGTGNHSDMTLGRQVRAERVEVRLIRIKIVFFIPTVVVPRVIPPLIFRCVDVRYIAVMCLRMTAKPVGFR